MNDFYSFDLETQALKELAKLPEGRAHFSLTAVKGAIFLIGGERSKSHLFNSILKFYPEKNRWEQLATKKQVAVSRHSAVQLEDSIIVSGGISEKPENVCTLQSFSISSLDWQDLPVQGHYIPGPLHAHKSLIFDNHLVLLSAESESEKIYQYDLKKYNWTVARADVQLQGATALLDSELHQILVFGGKGVQQQKEAMQSEDVILYLETHDLVNFDATPQDSPIELPILTISSPSTDDLTSSSSSNSMEKVPKDFHRPLKTPTKSLIKQVKKAILDYKMIQEGDRVLLGLSGGKDSLTLLHTLAHLRDHKGILGFSFQLAACTVDPQTESYQPKILTEYMASLGIPYFFESQAIIERAKSCSPDSICAWCSRHKRGILCATARREKFNVLALGQHLDDCAETFLMSAFHNGILRGMKASFSTPQKDIRIVRPFIDIRERELRKFAVDKGLPVISDNCPACFKGPTERERIKQLLQAQEQLYPSMFNSLSTALKPLMDESAPSFNSKSKKTSKKKNNNNNNTNNNNNNNNNSSTDDFLDDDFE